MNDLTFTRTPLGDRHDLMIHPGVGSQDGTQGDSLPILVRYLRIAKRWKWLMVGAVAVCVILGLTLTLLMTPLYTATATLEIQRENDRIVKVEGVEPESTSVDGEFYQTQYGLLKARSLAERVARELRLYDDAAFFQMFGAEEEADQLQEGGTASSAAARQQRTRKAGEILLEHVNVSPVRMSRLVGVEFTSADPALSARVVNAWTGHFIETTLERKFEATSYARRFLEQRLEQLRQRLEQSEQLLVAYAARQGIVNLTSTTTSSATPGATVTERSLVSEDLAAINQELNEATAARVSAQSRLRGGGGTTVEALQNQAISGLRERRAELAVEYAKLLAQFQPEYPAAQALASQIEQIDKSIQREESRVRSTLQDTYQAAAAREAALSGRVQNLRGNLLDLRRRTIQYNIHQREVDTNRQLYDALLQRYKEIGVAAGVGVNNVSVVDTAPVPEEPSSPNLLLNLLLAGLIGVVIGTGLALALEQIDEAISDPADVERTLALPLLGTVPKVDSEDPRLELEDRKSPMVEAYLSTQTSLAFTTDHGIPRSLTITSTRPGEGKTTTSYALARSLARTGRRVILVDADMRSPSLHHFFGVKNSHGLSNYLAGGGDLSALVHKDAAHGVALMSAGPPPPNAAELLAGDRLRQLLDELGGSFDHVILDAPPVMGLADTPMIASRVEGTIFVIESHATRSSMARVAIGRLNDARVRMLGVVLTKFESKRAHYGYGYDYGYSYGETAKNAA